MVCSLVLLGSWADLLVGPVCVLRDLLVGQVLVLVSSLPFLIVYLIFRYPFRFSFVQVSLSPLPLTYDRTDI